MKPPSKEAVNHALMVLLQSINQENGTNFATKQSDQRVDYTLSELDFNDQAFQTTLESVGLATMTWAASIRKPRNALIPIRKLPIELMVEVLLASLRVKDRTNMKRLQELARVCTLWRELVISFPRFWTTINSTEALALKLRRSGNMPLIIALHHLDKGPAKRTVQALGHHIHRWKRVQSSGIVTEALVVWLKNPAPLLEKVDYSGDFPNFPERLHLPTSQSLREVRLRAAVVPWSGLSGLTKLYIADISSASALPTATKLIDILWSCPRLEELELRNFEPVTHDFSEITDDGRPTGSARSSHIELPNLRRLVLWRIGSGATRAIICSISAESLVDFQLLELPPWRFAGTRRSALITDQCRSLVHNVIRNSLIHSINVVILRASLKIQGTFSGGRGRLLIHHHDWQIGIIRALTNLIPTNINTSLILSLYQDHPVELDEEVIRLLLDRMPGIELLNLHAHVTTMVQVVDKLSGPHPSSHSGPESAWWPGQHLSTLLLNTAMMGHPEYKRIRDGVRGMLASRSEATGLRLPPLEVYDEVGNGFMMSDDGEIMGVALAAH